MSPALAKALATVKPLLAVVAAEKDGEMWRFPFTRGLHNDLRFGDHHAGTWVLQRILLEQQRASGPPELISALKAAVLAATGGAQ